jgi:hypothetical protein
MSSCNHAFIKNLCCNYHSKIRLESDLISGPFEGKQYPEVIVGEDGYTFTKIPTEVTDSTCLYS